MSSAEFTEWSAYYTLEPFGQWRDNWHFGQLTALMHNINAKKQLSTDDFMYRDATAHQDKRDREFLARIDAVAKRKPDG